MLTLFALGSIIVAGGITGYIWYEFLFTECTECGYNKDVKKE